MSYVAASVFLDASLDALTRYYMWATIIGVLGAWVGLVVLICQTAISRTAADAAKASAEAAIVGERAWVMADIEHDSEKWADRKVHILQGSGTGGDTTSFYAALICRNEGRTPAWLGERRAKLEIVRSLPEVPNIELMEIIEVSPTPLGMGQAVPHTERISFPIIAKGHEELGKMTVIYGVVKYRDIFGKDRQTTFGYKITPDRRFVRLENYPKYNENT